jgi:hypothetical protein
MTSWLCVQVDLHVKERYRGRGMVAGSSRTEAQDRCSGTRMVACCEYINRRGRSFNSATQSINLKGRETGLIVVLCFVRGSNRSQLLSFGSTVLFD